MKTMCPPGYNWDGFLATHAIGNSWHFLRYLLFASCFCEK